MSELNSAEKVMRRETRKTMALGYIWGLQDANDPLMRGVEIFRFCDWYADSGESITGPLNTALKKWRTMQGL